MKNFLVDAGMWCCVEPKAGQTVDPDLDQRTLAKINLSIKPKVAIEIRKAKTSKEAWQTLKNLHEDSGVIRLVGLYAKLMKTNFDDFSSMEDYLAHISTILQSNSKTVEKA